MYPGFAHLRRADFSKALIYTLVWAPLLAVSLGAGTQLTLAATIPLMFATTFLPAISTYEAFTKNRYLSLQFKERNNLKDLMLSPFNFKDHLKKPSTYAILPIALLTSFFEMKILKLKNSSNQQEIGNQIRASLSKHSGGPIVLLSQVMAIAYMAGVGEEALVRGVIQPMMQGYRLKQGTKLGNLEECLPNDVEFLTPDEFNEGHKAVKANLGQGILFAYLHGASIRPTYVIPGVVFGKQAEDNINNAAFAHTWYDVFAFMMLINALL